MRSNWKDETELAASVMRHVGRDEDARALVRLLAYAAAEAGALKADLARSLILASLEAINLELVPTQGRKQEDIRPS